MKRVQIRSFLWSIFSRFWTEYGEWRSKSPYLVQIRENTDRKRLRNWTLFIQLLNCLLLAVENLCFKDSRQISLTNIDFTEKLFLCLTKGALSGTVLDGYIWPSIWSIKLNLISFYFTAEVTCTLLHCHGSTFQKKAFKFLKFRHTLPKLVIKSNVKTSDWTFIFRISH